MNKGKILKIFLLILIHAFYLYFSLPVHAQEKSCQFDINISTLPGDADHSKINPPLKFDPGNPDEIECGVGKEITLKVLDGCPPFIWEPPGKGYSWLHGEDVEVEGVIVGKKTKERSNQLQCITGT